MPTKKECLNDLVSKFLTEIDKLNRSSGAVRQRNFDNSFFLGNDDVDKIENRKRVMEHLFKSVETNIFASTTLTESQAKRFISTSYNLDQKKAHMHTHIDSIPEEDCGKVLSDFLTFTNEWKSDQKYNNNSYDAATMGTDQRKNALTAHSFNDAWVFTFLAKLIMMVEKTLGMKTSSEKLLDQAEEDINTFNPAP